MRILSSIKRIYSLALFAPMIVFGQASLKGSVTDAVSNETLIGTNVIVQGTSLGAATDIEGQYRIAGIPERVLNIKISCIGYATQIIEIDFSKTKDVQKNIQMKPQVIQGEEVVVTAQMRGQLAAINQQITSNRNINVVSEEKIQELPDANAAEAIGRLPGVSIIRSGGEASRVVLRGLSSKFSNITIDGVKIPPTDPNSRDVDLSMISQGALAGIELYKTLTPDQDADAIAGGINMVTRKAPSDRLIRLDLKGDYNQLMKSAKQYDFALHYGERFFDDLLGVQLQGNTERKIRSQENISYGYTTTDRALLPGEPSYDVNEYDNDYYINRFTVRFTDEIRTRNGFQTIFDFNTPDSGSVKFSGVFAETNRNYMIYEKEYLTWYDNFEQIEQKTATRNASLQGKNYLFGLTVDWNASFAESKITNPKDFRTMFSGDGGESTSPIKDHPERLLALAYNNFANAMLDSMTIFKTENYDKEQTVQLNLSKDVTLFDMFTNGIKIGAKYKSKSRWLDNYGYSWNTYQTVPFLDAQGAPIDFSGTSFEGTTSHVALSRFVDMAHTPTRNLLGLYTMTPLIDRSDYDTFYSMVKNATLSAAINYGTLGMLPLGNYFVTERVSAAYLMDDIDIGQYASLLVGVRVEKEQNNYESLFGDAAASGTGNVITLPRSSMTDTTTSYMKTIWLPNAQLNLKPTDYLTLRFAAYKALARPDFNFRLPQFSYSSTSSPSSGSGNYVNLVVGNTELENTTAWNYEANAQVYSNTIGLITLTGYYKIIDNMAHQINAARVEWTDDPNKVMGSYAGAPKNSEVGYHRLDNLIPLIGLSQWLKTPAFSNILHTVGSKFTVTSAYNSPSPSYVWGFEFEHQMNFRFLPVKWLQNITLSYNVSVSRSETHYWMEKILVDTLYVPARFDRFGRPISPDTFSLALPTPHTLELEKKPMEDQPDVTGNITFGYDIWDFSIRLSMFYQDRYVRSYSANGTTDAVVGELIKWDLSMKQQLTSKISVMLNVDNLFNRTDTRWRQNTVFNWGDIPTAASSYGTTIDLGVRVSL